MKKVIIDESRCIGCGVCKKDCVAGIIDISEGKAKVESDHCIKCGHCLAVCPVNAVTLPGYDQSQVLELKDQPDIISPEDLITTIKSLRTIRQFKDEDIEEDTIREIIEAGRYGSTSGNMQNVRYIVVRQDIEKIEAPVLKRIKKIQKVAKVISKVIKLPYDISSIPFEKGFLFKNAPVLILTVSKSTVDGALASRSMELMMKAKGLGGLYVGFFTAIANGHKGVRKALGLSKKEKVVTCLAIGKPDVKYYRTVPRNEANISFK